MDSRLLSRTDADSLSISNVADGIGLRELERDPSYRHVAHGRFGQILVLGHNIRKIFTGHRAIIAALLHAHAKDLTGFSQLRFVSRVNLYNGIFSLFLFL